MNTIERNTTANSGFALCGQLGSLANLSYF